MSGRLTLISEGLLLYSSLRFVSLIEIKGRRSRKNYSEILHLLNMQLATATAKLLKKENAACVEIPLSSTQANSFCHQIRF
ncbi:MAG: hypothetical protein PUP93_04015 [Rhizonema sp. NSF051]|nr:hypothetical protein [Rhizonema sp. NSF051]